MPLNAVHRLHTHPTAADRETVPAGPEHLSLDLDSGLLTGTRHIFKADSEVASEDIVCGPWCKSGVLVQICSC